MRYQCECGKIVDTDEIVEFERKHLSKDENVLFTKCPDCNENIYIQIDNAYTENLEKILKAQIKEIKAHREKGHPIPKKLFESTNKNLKKLQFTQSFLADKYKYEVTLAREINSEM